MEPLRGSNPKARRQQEGQIGQTAPLADKSTPMAVRMPPAKLADAVERRKRRGAKPQRPRAPQHRPHPRQRRSHPGQTRLRPQPAPAVPEPGAGHNGKRLPQPVDVEYSTTAGWSRRRTCWLGNRVIAGDINDPGSGPTASCAAVLATMSAGALAHPAITSPNENASQTLTAINLAISISQEVNQTVMLDLDLRKAQHPHHPGHYPGQGHCRSPEAGRPRQHPAQPPATRGW